MLARELNRNYTVADSKDFLVTCAKIATNTTNFGPWRLDILKRVVGLRG